jgi:hypothetical protein
MTCLLTFCIWLEVNAAPLTDPIMEDQRSLAPSSFESEFGLVGTASCSARACHGGFEAVPGQRVRQNEFVTWTAQDLHADAYRVLESERSKNIEARLRGSDLQKATDDAVCLNCHVFPNVKKSLRAPGVGLEEVMSFGVGCEACHGPAAKWLKPHTFPDWNKDRAADLGMWRIHDPLDRVRRCVTCHVGSPTSDMSHDLIAAGHPRLNFEFTLYMANLPRHWNTKAILEPDSSQEAIAWKLGQAVTATAALRLLEYRAAPAARSPDGSLKPWPEFAEYDCFSCHHDLQGAPSWRQERKEKPIGSLVWNNWYTAMPRSLARLDEHQDVETALIDLAKSMEQPVHQREQVARGAKHVAHLIQQWPDKASGKRMDAEARKQLLDELIDGYLASAAPDWDISAQLYLAIAALDRQHDESLKQLADALMFRGDEKDRSVYDSPKVNRKGVFDGLLRKFPR